MLRFSAISFTERCWGFRFGGRLRILDCRGMFNLLFGWVRPCSRRKVHSQLCMINKMTSSVPCSIVYRKVGWYLAANLAVVLNLDRFVELHSCSMSLGFGRVSWFLKSTLKYIVTSVAFIITLFLCYEFKMQYLPATEFLWHKLFSWSYSQRHVKYTRSSEGI